MSLILEPDQGRGALYLGDIDSANAVSRLKEKGVGAVLTVAELSGVRYAKEEKILHLIISADDVPSFNLAKYFDKGIAFIS